MPMSLFDTSIFLTRSCCGEWSLAWMRLTQAMDFALTLIYAIVIPAALASFARRRWYEIPYPWLLYVFAVVIFWCGMTYFNEFLVWWWPAYKWFAVVKTVTVFTSIGGGLGLWYCYPTLMRLRSCRTLGVITDRLLDEASSYRGIIANQMAEESKALNAGIGRKGASRSEERR